MFCLLDDAKLYIVPQSKPDSNFPTIWGSGSKIRHRMVWHYLGINKGSDDAMSCSGYYYNGTNIHIDLSVFHL